jgi:hypothetical protein
MQLSVEEMGVLRLFVAVGLAAGAAAELAVIQSP